jgi:inward rectifier potassium channel
MRKAAFDPGLTNQYTGTLRRTINRDGSFNVYRRGMSWRDNHPYLRLINMSWAGFLGNVLAAYLTVNFFFAFLYMAAGSNEVSGTDAPTWLGRFQNIFFFSAQTLTTVGYGAMAPRALGANIIAAFESMLGVLGFALATGLLYGRVSRPSARIGFSANALIAPYQDGTSLQFRVVNRRQNSIVELEARVMLMLVERTNGEFKRNFTLLPLERSEVLMFPMTWTVVHPIDKDSPLFGKAHEDLKELQAEILIFIKGYDDTFSQTVHARYSYRFDEFEWGAKFTPAFEIDREGAMHVHVNRISNHEHVRS